MGVERDDGSAKLRPVVSRALKRAGACPGRNGAVVQHYGMYGGVMYSGISGLVLRGREPWTLHTHVADRDAVRDVAH